MYCASENILLLACLSTQAFSFGISFRVSGDCGLTENLTLPNLYDKIKTYDTSIH